MRSIGKNPSVFSVIGQKLLRGGRLRKRGGAVVSFSPYMADLLGSTSRAAVGGALVLGSTLALSGTAAAQACDPATLVCSGSTTTAVDIVNPTGPITVEADFVANVDIVNAFQVQQYQSGPAVDLTIAGSITSTNGNAVSILDLSTSGVTSIAIEEGAEISGALTSIVASTATDLSISQNGTLESSGSGILAASSKSISVDVGGVIDVDGDGVNLTANGDDGDIDVTVSGEITAGADGIDLASEVEGNVNVAVVEGGVVTAEYNGIQINHTGSGDVSVDVAGELNVGEYGVAITSSAGGTIDVNVSGTIQTSGDYSAILVRTSEAAADINVDLTGTLTADDVEDAAISAIAETAGDILINTGADSSIDGYAEAIEAFHSTSGDITITSAGTLGLDDGAGLDAGIITVHAGSVGNVNVTNDGSITAKYNGIVAGRQGGSGSVTVANNGDIFDAGLGLLAFSNASGNIEVSSAGNIINAANGIMVDHEGIGNVIVNNSGFIGADETRLTGQEPVSGIEVTASGIGNAAITNDGTISGINGNAINATHENLGDLSIVNNDEVSASRNGIFAVHNDLGNLSVSNTDLISGINENAIFGIHSGVGNTELLNSGVIDNSQVGIFAYHEGAGSIVVRNLGGTISDAETGIIAEHHGIGSVAVSNSGDIFGVNTGINLLLTSVSTADVTNTGTISDAEYGIDAFGMSTNIGDVTVLNQGTIRNVGSAINVEYYGRGNVELANESLITDVNSGLYAEHYNVGDVTVRNSGTIGHSYDPETDTDYFADHGIDVIHFGNGDINVTNSGFIRTDYEAIYVEHAGNFGDINITTSATSGTYSYTDDAIYVGTGATGDLVANIAGTVETGGDDYDAIDLEHWGRGDIRGVISADITATGDDARGLEVTHWGTGNIDLIASGTIEAGDDGISVSFGDYYESYDADNMPTGNITLDFSGDIYSGDDGIEAAHYGTGNIDIKVSGTISASDDGITLMNHGTGDASIDVSGTIRADYGIYNYSYGTGDVDITSSGTIHGEYYGISQNRYGDGDTVIASTGTITAGEYSAVYINQSALGLVDVTVHNAANGVSGETGTVEEYASDSTIRIRNNSSAGINLTTTGNVYGSGRLAVELLAAGGLIDVDIAQGSTVGTDGGSSTTAILIGSIQQGNMTSLDIGVAGTLTGSVDLGGTDLSDSSTFVVTSTGTWDSTSGENYFSAGEDSVVINGLWKANNSRNYFDAVEQYGSLPDQFLLALPPVADDHITVGVGGQLDAAGATFDGLEQLTVHGTLNLSDGTVNQVTGTAADILLSNTSTFVVDAGADSLSDTLVTSGVVTLEGGTLSVVHTGTQAPTIGDVYTIIEASEVVGSFNSTEVLSSAFLGWSISQTDETVDLTYEQLRDLEEAGQTPNQIETAGALDTLPASNELVDTLLYAENDAAARAAFDQLTGEIHPGVRTALAEDSRLPRNAVLERLQGPQGSSIWGQVIRSSGESDGNNRLNIAENERNTWGYLLGADVALGDDAAIGVAGAYLNNKMAQPARRASAKADTFHALAYVGARTGNFGIKAGAGYAWGDVRTTRNVQIEDFSDTLKADYNATLFQAFAEAGVRVGVGGGYVEPIAGLTHISATTDAFRETGGAAALTAAKETHTSTISTLGARFSTSAEGAFSVRGMLGWQHNFDGQAPTTRFNFTGSDGFTITGAGQSRDAAAANLEANFKLSDRATLAVGYDGVIGRQHEDHAAKVRIHLAF